MVGVALDTVSTPYQHAPGKRRKMELGRGLGEGLYLLGLMWLVFFFVKIMG